jgi:LmbE family N-acetylglucosaminyl deacetylase
MINILNGKILAFFAHPDDETLGAGATLSRLARQGSEIHVAIPATGVLARKNTKNSSIAEGDLVKLRKDCIKAQGILGIPAENIHLGNFSDNEIDKHTLLDLIKWLENIISVIKPDVIFTHHRFCTNIDHQYCHEAAVVATRPSKNSHIALIAAEIPSSTGYLKPSCWDPNFYIEVSEKDVRNKIKAMETYKNESRLDPHPRSPEVLNAIAKVRGSESGYMWAEAFMVQKILI